MPFCPKCGTQVNSDASFCLSCGANLRTIGPSTTGQVSMKEKGGVLEDSIAGYFRRMGFDVQPRVRMRDRFDVSHEIDVLASKREAFGTIQVAVECKYVTASIDIKEVRNFHGKLSALGITKGVFVSTGGFTADAESHASALGIELWDMKTLQDKMAESAIPQKDVIYDALPVNLTMINALSPRHLRNSNVFSETIRLNYRPYYLVDYHCFSQHTVAGNSVLLESKGKMIIDGVTGQIVDSKTSTGKEPALPKMGPYVGCISIQPETITSANLPAQLPLLVIGPEVDSVRARDVAKIELVKSLSLEYIYHTARTTGRKLLKPRKKDIDILNVQLIKIPLLIGIYRFRDRAYTRISLAPTGVLVLDQTASCVQCQARPVYVCENCGGLACESHSKNCTVCGKNLCSNCVISKGIISKKYYCAQHKPGD